MGDELLTELLSLTYDKLEDRYGRGIAWFVTLVLAVAALGSLVALLIYVLN